MEDVSVTETFANFEQTQWRHTPEDSGHRVWSRLRIMQNDQQLELTTTFVYKVPRPI
jgi:hypothetical protein